MKKTKADYIIVGTGNLAKHLKHYFSYLNIKFIDWQPDPDKSLNAGPNKVLLAIPDNKIEEFINENNQVFCKSTFIHFSGILNINNAVRCHPLMTFSERLYSPDFYESILFCLDEGSPKFEVLFPKLRNPNIVIPDSLRPYYINLCSLVNKFTSIPWEKFYDDVIDGFDIDSGNIESFLNKAISKIQENYQTYLNGFFSSEESFSDKISNINLTPVKKLYDSFVKVHNEHLEELFGRKGGN